MLRTLLLTTLVSLSVATTYTWTNAGPNNLWDSYANWSPNGVPTADDDCELTLAGTALVGTANGAQCSAVTVGEGVTLSISGALASFGTMKVAGTVTVDGGEGGLAVTKEAELDGSLTWKSGRIAGDWTVGSQGALVVGTNTGLVRCSGTWINKGRISIVDSNVFMCPVTNDGQIEFPVGGPTTLSDLQLAPQSTGRVTVSSTVNMLKVLMNNVVVQAKASLIAIAGSQASLATVNVEEGAVLGSTQPSTLAIKDLKCPGTLSSTGAASFIEVSADAGVYIANAVLAMGNLVLRNKAVIGVLQMAGGGLELSARTIVGKLTSTGGALRLTGAGPLEAGTTEITDRATIACNLLVTKSIVLGCKQIIFDATVTIEEAATASVGGTPSFWGPSDASSPGSVINNGALTFIGPNATINTVTVAGSGKIAIEHNTTVDFQNGAVAASEVALKAGSSVVRGESLLLSYDSLVGPRVGSLIGLANGPLFTTCVSPCNASHPTTPAQIYVARVTKV